MIKRSEDDEYYKGLWHLFATTLGNQGAGGNGRHKPENKPVTLGSFNTFRWLPRPLVSPTAQAIPPTATRPANPWNFKANIPPCVNSRTGISYLRNSVCPFFGVTSDPPLGPMKDAAGHVQNPSYPPRIIFVSSYRRHRKVGWLWVSKKDFLRREVGSLPHTRDDLW